MSSPVHMAVGSPANVPSPRCAVGFALISGLYSIDSELAQRNPK
jgi:hypothetical protein